MNNRIINLIAMALSISIPSVAVAEIDANIEQAQNIPSIAMNIFSQEAKIRTELFESISKRNGFNLINGRWGGEFNNDHLALKEQDGRTLLLLGLKLTSPEGNLQLDQMSMGSFVQLSPLWLSAVIQSLKLDKNQSEMANKLERARNSKTLDTMLLLFDKVSNNVKFLKVRVPE
ncbi:hypothetical protein HA050_20185 [Iodobacter sp. HSC-16F04]|uniref:Uncharacterized protein n=1 Tax=Iodobacter violaceini TaxID=3044271 RepID=A0ABX0L0P3_9NEIS|nr:hypothetical protein [Iodobacter violacea]NHQ88423.1 hypothetical protein [Iodobacter violacea]